MPALLATRRMTALVTIATAALVASCEREAPPPARAATTTSGAHVAITRPTVIAWFVIPPGAVDTMPDLAVEADDWNVNMATLRDSLESSGIDLAMVLDSAVTVTAAGRRDTVLTLGAFRSAGYVFVRTNGLFCVRRGGSEADTVIATARAYVNGRGCT